MDGSENERNISTNFELESIKEDSVEEDEYDHEYDMKIITNSIVEDFLLALYESRYNGFFFAFLGFLIAYQITIAPYRMPHFTDINIHDMVKYAILKLILTLLNVINMHVFLDEISTFCGGRRSPHCLQKFNAC